MCLSKERKVIRSCYFCSCGTIDHQTVGNLCHPFLRLSLLHECPPTQESTICHPEGKALLLRQGHGGFSAFLGATHVATELMEHRRTNEGGTQVIGMRQLLRQRHRFLTLRQPLVGIP